MERKYFISRHNDPKKVYDLNSPEIIEFNEYLNVLRGIPNLTNGMDSFKNDERYLGLFYYQFSPLDYANNHYSFIFFNTEYNKITAVHRGKENYKDVKMFWDIAKMLNADLWYFPEKQFIINEDYLNKIKEKEPKVSLTSKQMLGMEWLNFSCRWLIINTSQINLLTQLKATNNTEDTFENCIEEVTEGNKLLMANQKGWTMIMGLNLPYVFYKDKAEYESTTDHNINLIDALNNLSANNLEAYYFEFHSKYGGAAFVRSANGNLGYANFSYEEDIKEYFGETDQDKISINLNQTPVLELCKDWTGVTPEELILETIKKKVKVLTFKQESYSFY